MALDPFPIFFFRSSCGNVGHVIACFTGISHAGRYSAVRLLGLNRRLSRRPPVQDFQGHRMEAHCSHYGRPVPGNRLWHVFLPQLFHLGRTQQRRGNLFFTIHFRWTLVLVLIIPLLFQVPFTTMLALLCLWFGVSLPLIFIGYYFGYRKHVSFLRLIVCLRDQVFDWLIDWLLQNGNVWSVFYSLFSSHMSILCAPIKFHAKSPTKYGTWALQSPP